MTDQLQPVRCRAVFSDDLPMITQEQYDDMRRDRDEWKASCAQYHKANAALDKDRSALMTAIRRLRDAKGDYENQNAYEDMIALLPENDQGDGRRDGGPVSPAI